MDEDDPERCTIDGKVHTLMTTCFIDEADQLIGALFEKGVPNKLRPGRSFITRRPEPVDDSIRAKKKASRANGLGIVEIWLVGEIEDADRSFKAK